MSHRASLDVSAPVLKAVTGWIARHRRRPGARPAQRAGTVHTQVALALRWLRHRLDLRTLAAQAGLSIATAYRYLHEALDVIATYAPDLADVLDRAHAAGLPYVSLDGTLVPTDRVAARAERGHHLWYSESTMPSAATCRSSSTRPAFRCGSPRSAPGSTHDLTAARELVLPALYPHAARGLPGLADKGYTGAGVGIHVPVKHHPAGPLHTDNRGYNRLLTALRAPRERGNALLGRWRALDRVTVCPQRIGVIAAAALVLTSLDRRSR